MKTKILMLNIVIASVLAIVVTGCKKYLSEATDEEQNREFMAMFRKLSNTGNANDPKASQVVNTNDMYLVWNGITGAAGYHLKMKLQSGSWDNPKDILWDTIVGPDVLKYTKIDLQYSTKHNFAIQTLSPKGEGYHSKWYGLGDSGHNDDRAEWEMGERRGIPDVVSVSNVTENSMRVWFDRKVASTDPTVLNPQFQYENNLFIIDEILVQPAADNRDLPSKSVKLTPTDLVNGYIDVTGLSSNALYVVNGLNNGVKRYWDRLYNTSMVRMRGQIGAPVPIPCIVDDKNVAAQQAGASRLDTILNNYLFDNTRAEGTVFTLEAGKKYYLGNNVILAKGLTLRSNTPGVKAIVYMGLGYNDTRTASNAFNFQLGRNAQAGEIGSITVGDVVFDDIDFDVPAQVNFFTQSLSPGVAINGNYFINQSSAAMPFTCSRLEARNCNFQGMVRSWFRTQGSNRQVIENISIINCLFFNTGMYDVNGRGYPLITGAAALSDKTNIFNNVVIRNNSFIGMCYDQLIRETANLAWAPSVVWNITIENNTFLNAFSITNGRFLIQHNNPPANSKYTIKKNLFISVKAAGDSRDFFQSGMDFRTYRPGLSFDIADNYSTSAKSANGAVTYFTSAEIMANQPFSHNSRGAGFNGGALNIGGLEATKVITGPTPIAPENLMTDPYPKGKKVGANWETNAHQYNLNGLFFKKTSEVLNHPIYTKGIGDPRWR